MAEYISIYVGNAGVQIGKACWELYCLEHGIQLDGQMQLDDDYKSNEFKEYYSTSFFKETDLGRYSPRTILVDTDPDTIDEVKIGRYGKLFGGKQLVKGRNNAANIYARGLYTVGYEIIEETVESILKTVEECDGLQGFLIFHSSDGGTGSGFTTLLMDALDSLYKNVPKLDFVIYPPERNSTVVIEPYNSILSTNATMEYPDCTFSMDNGVIFDMCSKKLGIKRPTYTNVNNLIAQIVSGTTASLRFNGPLNTGIADLVTNLVPYQKLHFPIIAYAPIATRAKQNYEELTTAQITTSCFDPEHQSIKHKNLAKYISCCMLYRGNIIPSHCFKALSEYKKENRSEFMDRYPTNFKFGITNQTPSVVPESDMAEVERSVCMLANSSSIAEKFDEVSQKFDMLFSKRSFLHWYLAEGMEEHDFMEAKLHFDFLSYYYSLLNN